MFQGPDAVKPQLQREGRIRNERPIELPISALGSIDGPDANPERVRFHWPPACHRTCSELLERSFQ